MGFRINALQRTNIVNRNILVGKRRAPLQPDAQRF